MFINHIQTPPHIHTCRAELTAAKSEALACKEEAETKGKQVRALFGGQFYTWPRA
jgi:hypothetical protein